MIDTSKVSDRRKLRFKTPAEMMADVDRVVAADRAGTLRRCGNWTTGQILWHLAAWVDYSFDGNPLRPPWFIKLLLRFAKRRFLRGPLKAGVKIPRVKGGTLATEALPLDEALTRFKNAWARLEKAPPSIPNILFGPMTHDEWIKGHLRHAELHLSFLHPA